MIKLFFEKIKESAMSILPITLIVILLNLTPIIALSSKEIITFIICSLLLIFSMSIFSLGADVAMMPMGQFTGKGLVKYGKLSILLISSMLLGYMITIAEPDLSVLANQVKSAINGNLLVNVVGIGVGLFLTFAILKIVAHKSLSLILAIMYMVVFALLVLLCHSNKMEFFPVSFDSGGVTTGPITVPFIMAFGVGVAKSIGGRDSEENSFGLVSLCSVGPIIVMLILSILSKGNFNYEPEIMVLDDYLEYGIVKLMLEKALEIGKALGILLFSFFIIDILILKLPLQKIKEIILGLIITFIGLVIFLTTVDIGFVSIGYKIGQQIVKSKPFIVIGFGFLIGMTVVLAEPAVHVLNKQVEEITAGVITKTSMLIALSLGVGVSLSLCVIRQIYSFSLLYYIIPGYIISILLSLFVPPIYTAIAFDSGGVASGPMTSTFILPLMIGMCIEMHEPSAVLNLAFGVVAMVAMTPLITIQILGFKAVTTNYVRNRITMTKLLNSDDNKIVYFNLK